MADAVPPAGALQHRGIRAVQRLVEYAPATGGLALWVGHRDLDDAPGATKPPNTPTAQHAPYVPGLPNSPNGLSSPNAAPAATDGLTIFYRPAFDQLPLPQQAGQVAHQLLHIALRHPQRYLALQQLLGDVDLQLFNTCADAIVNSALAHLGWLQLAPGAVRLPGLLSAALNQQQADEPALLAWDVEALYRAIDDRRAPPLQPPPMGVRRQPSNRQDRQGGQGHQRQHSSQGGQGGQGHVGGPSGQPPQADLQSGAQGDSPRSDGPRAARVRALGQGTATDLLPDPRGLGPPEHEAEAERAWRERLLRGHAGDGELSLLRTLLADLPRSRTPWEQVLRSQLARALAQQPGPSWSRPSRSYIAHQGRAGPGRRMPWEPGTTASRAVPRLVVVVDVSGSVDAELLARFAREVDAITRRLGAGTVLVVGDDRVRQVLTAAPGDSGLAAIQFNGGGGTDFTPLLEEAQRHAPDLVLVLTDLQGPARFQPGCPVLWAVPEAWRHAQPPFGRLLVLR